MTSNLNEEGDEVKKEAAESSDEKTGEEKTPAATSAEQKTQSEPKTDFHKLYVESSKEALRLKERNEQQEKDLAQTQEVMEVLYDNPELLSKVQEAYEKKSGTSSEAVEGTKPMGMVPEKVLEEKVREKVSPLADELRAQQKQMVDDVVNEFSQKHPDAWENPETRKEILEWLPAMKARGLPLRQGLEKAHEIVTIDRAKQTGKLEAVKGIFERQQAAAGSGLSGAEARERSQEVELSSEEQKVARNLGIKPENYRKYK